MKLPSQGELSGRSVEEWIGATPDSVPPDRVKLRVLLRYERRCHWSGQLIRAADAWDVDHVIALANGGKNVESNLAPILRGKEHQAKTAADLKQKAKTDRLRRKHHGLWRSKHPLRSRGFAKVTIGSEEARDSDS